MIVTIDGPAGSGKSTAARALAARLGFAFLDTGAMFRTVALAAQRAGISWTDDEALDGLLSTLQIGMPQGGIVLLSGENVSGLIRTPEISEGASVVAARPPVRRRLAQLQRQIAMGRDMVCEGRDQGTVVFPDAECKFYLDANPEERLERRAKELQAKGQTVDIESLRRIQTERDERDSNRELAPLRAAADAVQIDTTGMTPDGVAVVMEQEVRRRMATTQG